MINYNIYLYINMSIIIYINICTSAILDTTLCHSNIQNKKNKKNKNKKVV